MVFVVYYYEELNHTIIVADNEEEATNKLREWVNDPDHFEYYTLGEMYEQEVLGVYGRYEP